jgi:hypothetical protein
MRQGIMATLLLLSSLVLVLGVYLAGCDGESPAGPVEAGEKDYVVYFWDGTSDLDYYGYHPLTGELDTFTTPYYAWLGGIKASADGKLLYVATSVDVAVVELDSLKLITEIPYRAKWGVAVSPDNRLLCLQGPGIRILSTADYSVLYEDTARGVAGCDFSANSSRLYCAGGGTGYSAYVLDIRNGFSGSVKEFDSSAIIWDILPSPDESKWFLYRKASSWCVFEVYDVAADSIIFRQYITYGWGEMAVTPDGRYVFFTEAGTFQDGLGKWYFTVFDVDRNRISRLISTTGIKDGLNPAYMPLGELAITPDGRWLVAGSVEGVPAFLRFNINTMEIDDYVEIDDNGGLMSYTCQGAE